MYRLMISITILFFCFILWVIYMADTGQGTAFFDFVKSFPLGDKVGHIFLFGVLTFGVNISTQFRKIHMRFIHIHAGTLIVSLFVLIEEGSQYFISTRTMDIADLAADAIGITLFTIASCIIGTKYAIERRGY